MDPAFFQPQENANENQETRIPDFRELVAELEASRRANVPEDEMMDPQN